MEKAKRFGSILLEIGWAATFLLLPITSLPWLSRLAGNSSVAPAAVLPLALIGVFWFLPYLAKRGRLPRESLPFLIFGSVALLASAAALFLDVPPFKDASVLKEEIRSFLTLAVGAAFYLVTAGWYSRFEASLGRAMRWINLSGALVILWSAVQAVFIFAFQSHYPAILLEFQRLVSTRDLFVGRITGFAFEPSWLGQQMNLLYIPVWLGASLAGYSAASFRLGKLSLENILLVLGIGTVCLASRVGTLALLLVLAFLGMYGNLALARRLRHWGQSRLEPLPNWAKKTIEVLLPAALLLVFAGAYAVATLVLVYGLSHVDARLARLFQSASLQQWLGLIGNPYKFFNYLRFAERYVDWVAGWNVFALHPFLGVGLGNAGFFFKNYLPAYGWSLPEIMTDYYRTVSLPNTKSMWIRLLAETGAAGFSAFLAWFYISLRSSLRVRRNGNPLLRTLGWAGIFVFLTYIVEGFSTDTFALPYLWTLLGLTSAAALLARSAE